MALLISLDRVLKEIIKKYLVDLNMWSERIFRCQSEFTILILRRFRNWKCWNVRMAKKYNEFWCRSDEIFKTISMKLTKF